jgi:putative ABC transport system permease protein
MRRLIELGRRLRALVRRNRLERDLDDELAFHLAMREEELARAGLRDPRHAAVRQFGNVARLREEVRDMWTFPTAESVWADVRSGGRRLTKDRTFSLIAVIALAFGIATNSTFFALVNAICLRGLPIDAPARVLYLGSRDGAGRPGGLSYAEFSDVRETSTSFERLAAMTVTSMTIGDPNLAPDRVQGAYRSAASFALLGVAPVAGRDFTAADDAPGAAGVAILGHGVWQARYGGDSGVLGRTVTVNGQTVTVVGIMPAGFRFPGTADLWLPLSNMPGLAALPRAARQLGVFARLKDGVAPTTAEAELTAVRAAWSAHAPEADRRVQTTARPINEQFNPSATDPTWLAFMTAGALVLLIACANVANLLLMRGVSRAKEIAVRASIGGTRARIVRQLLIEGVVLAAAAAVVGLGLSHMGLRILSSLHPPDALPYWMTFSLDYRVVGVLAGVALGSVLVFGLAPAVHLSRTDPGRMLHESGRGHTGGVATRRWMATFLAVECALTLVLLAAVAMSARQDLATARSEFRVDGARLLTMWVTLPEQTYASLDARRAFYARLSERLAGLPGGVRAALTSALPGGGGAVQDVDIRGRSRSSGAPATTALTIAVDQRYFAVTGVPVRGAGFSVVDGGDGHETAIVNERFVRLYLADRDPIGERIRVGGAAADGRWLQIVGVVPTVRQRGGLEPDPVVYQPLRGAPPTSTAIVASLDGDPAALSGPLRDTLREIDPAVAAYRVMTLEQAMHEARWNGRISNILLRSIALIGAVLSLVGLYAVTGHAVRQRRRELGVLAALGAGPGQLQWLVLRPALRPLAIGLLLGVGCVHAFDRLLGSATPPPIAMSDAATLVPLLAVVIVVAAAACLLPARRAARVDPVEALRSE